MMMNREGRTKKGLRNMKVALVFYFLYLFLNFISRKVFIDYLGVDILGLNTTATSMLQFFNIAELGMSSAIACFLYEPLYQKKYDEINIISSVQGLLLRYLTITLIIVSVILLLFFPIIFSDMKLPLWYAYTSYGVLLLTPLFGFLFNYKQIILTADQKQYKVTAITQSVKILKVLFQILAIIYLRNGYIYWLLLEAVFAGITTLSLNWVINKEYPWLVTSVRIGRENKKKYPLIVAKTKQILIHKIGGYITDQVIPFIVVLYSSLFVVAVYGNYILITKGVRIFVTALFNGIEASIGNLLIEGNKNKILQIFEEMFSLRFFLAIVICFVLMKCINPFMGLWLGEQYIFEKAITLLIIANLYIGIVRATVDNFITAYGLFQDVWAAVFEASCSLILAVILGIYYDIGGVLTGILVVAILINIFWKPYFLFRKGFAIPVASFIKFYSGMIVLSLACYFVVEFILLFLPLFPVSDYINFGSYVLTVSFLYSSILFILLFSFVKGFKSVSKRFYSLLQKR